MSWTAPSGQLTQYAYDPVGNRLSMSSSAGTTAYSYDAADRLLSAGSTTYSYDRNGSQIRKTTGSTTLNYTYDALNRLIAASGGGVNSQYQYDGDGNRVSQVVPTGTYQYVNDTSTTLPVVLGETGPNGNIDYLYGLSMISETSPTFQYFYQSDGLGSVATLTDATGALKGSYAYDPWGELATPLDPLGTKNKYKFTGQAADPGTGYYFLRARYYDPALGRLETQDPLSGPIGFPLSLNKYSYALNNPIRAIDPSGSSAVDAEASAQQSTGQSLTSASSAGRSLAKTVATCILDAFTGSCITGFINSQAESVLLNFLPIGQQTASDIQLLLEPSFFNSPSQTVPAQMRLINVENNAFSAIGSFLAHLPHSPGL